LSILTHHPFYIGAKFAQQLPTQPCLLCGAHSHVGLCCADCANDLPRLTGLRCPVCALSSPAGDVCGQCLRQTPAFDHTVAAFSYDFPVDKLIHALKFRERLIVADYLGEALAQRIVTLPDLIVPLPLHPTRLRERGFNQSLLLARHVSRRLGVPVLPDGCERVRDTPPQTSLPWQERDKNMRRAFACRPEADISGGHVAIVDDVMTTGASIGELARALKHAGAREVSAWVVARTLPHH
jgi:ComF family protein